MYAIAQRVIKFNTVAFSAALVTFSLFYFMQYLISSDENITRVVTPIRIVDATMPEIPNILIPEILKPEEIPKLEVIVETPPRDDSFAPSVISGPPIAAPQPPPPNGMPNIGLADAPKLPLIKIAPAYPRRALAQGIEGYVDVSFTVTELGAVADPVVLHAEPEGYFERAALTGIKKWKYSPEVDRGVAVPVHDVRQRLVFQMEK